MRRVGSGALIRALAGGTSLLMLAACGGGGGSGVNSASSNPATTTTTPAAPTYVADAEYNRSNGASDPGALTAWNAGATGAGQTIAVIDSGINTASTEFTGRISSASQDVASNRGVNDTEGHGTAVAAVAAAAHNGNDITGIAFGANILALRVDTVGSCATTTGCTFNSTVLANAVDLARINGAKVINLSLGGSPMPNNLVQAVGRATAAGIIIVIAAGNDGNANPDVFAQVASSNAANGLVVIAGSHDADGTYSSYADKAGSYANFFLTALGSGVRSFDHTGTDFLYTGTSFSTPAIAAAVALIEQAFPNLTPAQVVSLLYSSATDAGATGVDSTYGRGILNIAKAFQPVGTTALAGSQVAVTSSDQTILSSAMGDATLTGQSAGRAVVLDALGRAYTMNLTANVAHVAVSRPLVEAIGSDFRTTAQSLGPLSFSTTIARGFATGRPWDGLALGRHGFTQSVDARPVDGSVALRITPHTRFSFAYAQQGRTLADTLSGQGAPGSFLVARAVGTTPGFTTRTGQSFALLQQISGTDLTVTAERGTVPAASITDRTTPAYASLGVRAQRRFGRLSLSLGLSTLREAATVLGARLAPAFGRSGATTRYVDLDARYSIGGGWSLGAAWRNGWTRTDAGGVLDHSRIVSRSATADVSHAGQSSRLALRVALPPRVSAGGLMVTLPTAYDYTTGEIAYTTGQIGLRPQGQERDLEASYGVRLAGGWLDSNVYWRHQPSNIALAPEDVGAALRYSASF